MVSLAGGPSRQLLVKCANATAFASEAQGVYYVNVDLTDSAVHLVDPSTGRDRVLGSMEGYAPLYWPMGLAVSPDGTTILYDRLVNDSADLMLIENFR